jgi:hypothetical protein
MAINVHVLLQQRYNDYDDDDDDNNDDLKHSPDNQLPTSTEITNM